MRVLLVFTLNDVPSAAKPLKTPESLQLGLSYISSLLKKHGHETQLLVASRVFQKQGLAYLDEILLNFNPEVIGFSAVSSEFKFVCELADHVRAKHPNIRQVVGGAHVSLDPQSAVDRFDAICIGEGEFPMLEYLTQLDEGRSHPTDIKNLWLKQPDGSMQQNIKRPFLSELDELPHPDREMWERWIGEERSAKPSVLLGRGCPFQCTYCCHHKFRSLGEGAYVRFRNPKAIVEEIREILMRNPHYREIYLEQETIGVKLAWTESLCDELAALNFSLEKPVTFGVNLAITPNIDYDRLFTALKRASIRYVNIGLESGNEKLRRETLKRRYTNDDVLKAVTSAKKQGLKVALFNMIGLPGETPELFQDTLDMNRKCQPDWHYTSIFYPYPGTDLYRVCKEQGLLAETTGTVGIDMERSQSTLDLPGFSKKQIQQAYEWFDYNVYLGQKPRYRLFAKVIRSKIKRKPWLNHLYRAAARSTIGSHVDRMLNPYVERIEAQTITPR